MCTYILLYKCIYIYTYSNTCIYVCKVKTATAYLSYCIKNNVNNNNGNNNNNDNNDNNSFVFGFFIFNFAIFLIYLFIPEKYANQCKYNLFLY